MNEQLQKALADILTMLQQSAETVGGAAQQEIPLLVQEYLRWGFWKAVIVCLAWVVLTSAVVLIGNRLRRQMRADAKEKSYGFLDASDLAMGRGLVLLAQFGVFMLGVTSAIDSMLVALQVTVAPRVYLLETVIGAIK